MFKKLATAVRRLWGTAVRNDEVLLELINRKLDLVLLKLDDVERRERKMSVQLDALKVQVERCHQVVDSAVVLISGLADQIKALKDDPVELQKLADDMKAQADSLAAAVAANTPPAPPTP